MKINENHQRDIQNIINKINNEINDRYEEIDVVIWDLLDGISDKGNDEMVTREVESWIKSVKK